MLRKRQECSGAGEDRCSSTAVERSGAPLLFCSVKREFVLFRTDNTYRKTHQPSVQLTITLPINLKEIKRLCCYLNWPLERPFYFYEINTNYKISTVSKNVDE